MRKPLAQPAQTKNVPRLTPVGLDAIVKFRFVLIIICLKGDRAMLTYFCHTFEIETRTVLAFNYGTEIDCKQHRHCCSAEEVNNCHRAKWHMPTVEKIHGNDVAEE